MAEANSSRRRLRTKLAAPYIGSTESTMEKWRVTGIGPPFIRLGSRIVVYDTEDLDAYMAARRACSTSDRTTVAALVGTDRASNRKWLDSLSILRAHRERQALSRNACRSGRRTEQSPVSPQRNRDETAERTV